MDTDGHGWGKSEIATKEHRVHKEELNQAGPLALFVAFVILSTKVSAACVNSSGLSFPIILP
jgi:hypothetical protein